MKIVHAGAEEPKRPEPKRPEAGASNQHSSSTPLDFLHSSDFLPSSTHVPRPTVPRLDTRHIATLSSITLPDSVLAQSARTGKDGERTLLSRMREGRGETERGRVARRSGVEEETLKELKEKSSPPSSSFRNPPASSSSKEVGDPPPLSTSSSPASEELRRRQADRRRAGKGREERTGYRWGKVEDEARLDQRVSNHERLSASQRLSSSPPLIPSSSLPKSTLSKVFLAEGKTVRSLIMRLNPRNMRWLKHQFLTLSSSPGSPALNSLNSGQFVETLTKVLDDPEVCLEVDAAMDSEMELATTRKVVGYGVGYCPRVAAVPLSHSGVGGSGRSDGFGEGGEE